MNETLTRRTAESRDTFTSVERAFHIVALIADASDGLTLSVIARELHVNKAIADRLLATLLKIGLVWRDDRLQTFHLTYRISNLGLKQLQRGHLLDLCSSELRQLADETGELARLSVVENGDSITWVYAAAGQKRALQIDPNYTLEIDLHAHATGKAWLSTMPFSKAWDLVEKRGVSKLTPYTITDKAALEAELTQATQRGFAVSRDESEVGVGAVAAPIWAATIVGGKECVGCVSLGAPSSRMSLDDFAAMGPRVIETTDNLGRQWPFNDQGRHLRNRSFR
jgi:DNA-binding IclR family transcriptional regulator